MKETTDTNSGAHVGAESHPETESLDDLIGRTVQFFWSTYHRKPLPLRGEVICAGRIPDTVVIRADEHPVPMRSIQSRQKKWLENITTKGALHCRPVSEIEVLV